MSAAEAARRAFDEDLLRTGSTTHARRAARRASDRVFEETRREAAAEDESGRPTR